MLPHQPLIDQIIIPFSRGIIFLQIGEGTNPLRIATLAIVALVWLFCFATLFYKDKRKARLKTLAARRKSDGFVEKRASARISYPMNVLYRVVDPPQAQGNQIMSNARDLSATGILLEVMTEIPLGSRVELKLVSSGKVGSLVLHGVVRRQESLPALGVKAVGVALEPRDEKERMRLMDFIDQERRKEHAG